MNIRDFFTKNHFLGKVMGAFFGYLMAGPFGAFLGILIGNVFDHGLNSHFTRPHWQYYAERRKAVQDVFFKATFTVMGNIAKADGRVSEKEIKMAQQLMREFGLSAMQKEQAKVFFNEGKESDFDWPDMVSKLSYACQKNPELLKLFLDIQYRAAHVDGINELKLKRLNAIFTQLGFAPLYQQYRFYQDFSDAFNQERVHRQRRNSGYQQTAGATGASTDTLSQAYAILELVPPSSKQEVKKAYRRLMSRNHPDKLIAKGLPESMIKVANEKTQAISKAYEQICAAKGW